jgi:hypothetical protein
VSIPAADMSAESRRKDWLDHLTGEDHRSHGSLPSRVVLDQTGNRGWTFRLSRAALNSLLAGIMNWL